MIYKNFRFVIFIRVMIIVTLSVALAFVLVKGEMFFVPTAITLLLVVAVVSLIRYLEKANRDLTHFLLSIRQGAFTESYSAANRGRQYEQLSEALNEVVAEFRKVSLEKELHYQYLQALNENISVAILSFEADGKLLMMNAAAKSLLDFPAFSRIEHFKNIDPELYKAVRNIQPGQRVVVKSFVRAEQYQLSVQVKEIILNNNLVRIILLQNISKELEAQEIEAWHQLMKVLTHEIMNSVTPIYSLTAAIDSILKSPDGTRKDFNNLSDDSIDDVFNSLATIRSRSKGLLQFVKAYKEYAKPITVRLESTDITALVKRVVVLLTPELQRLAIKLTLAMKDDPLIVEADTALIEQVLINLIKNAMEAVAHDGTGNIHISILPTDDRVSISMADNGRGIDPEIMPRIFVPFFTTKAKGTGIGLSLSRQIMQLHNGAIRVQSSEKGSVFTIDLGVAQMRDHSFAGPKKPF